MVYVVFEIVCVCMRDVSGLNQGLTLARQVCSTEPYSQLLKLPASPPFTHAGTADVQGHTGFFCGFQRSDSDHKLALLIFTC